MHEHDTDLIMALAEHTLGAAAAAAAAVEIGDCAHCSESLALQIVALDAIAAAPEATLNEFESARIRRNLRRELGIAGEVVTPTRRRRFLPAAVLGSAAAVLLAVVVAGGALQNLGGDDADTFASADFAETTTTASASRESVEAPLTAQSPTATESAAATESAGATAADGAGDVLSDAEEAPATSTMAPPKDLVPVVGTPSDLPDLRDLVINAAGDLDQTRALSLLQFQSQAGGLAESGEAECSAGSAEELSAIDFFTVAVGEINENQVVVVAYVTDPVEGTVLIAHDAVTCEAVAQVP